MKFDSRLFAFVAVGTFSLFVACAPPKNGEPFANRGDSNTTQVDQFTKLTGKVIPSNDVNTTFKATILKVEAIVEDSGGPDGEDALNQRFKDRQSGKSIFAALGSDASPATASLNSEVNSNSASINNTETAISSAAVADDKQALAPQSTGTKNVRNKHIINVRLTLLNDKEQGVIEFNGLASMMGRDYLKTLSHTTGTCADSVKDIHVRASCADDACGTLSVLVSKGVEDRGGPAADAALAGFALNVASTQKVIGSDTLLELDFTAVTQANGDVSNATPLCKVPSQDTNSSSASLK